MEFELSAGVVIFRKNKEIKYLLLQKENGKWDFPKGNVENREKMKVASIREVNEETGINDLSFVDGFKEDIDLFYRLNNKLIKKRIEFYLAETKTTKIKLSYEHKGYEWLNYEEASERLNFRSQKELLRKADKVLSGKVSIQKGLNSY